MLRFGYCKDKKMKYENLILRIKKDEQSKENEKRKKIKIPVQSFRLCYWGNNWFFSGLSHGAVLKGWSL